MRGQSATLEEIELSQPLTERVVFPLARKFGQFAVKFTPQNALQNTAHRLELAGIRVALIPRFSGHPGFWQQLLSAACSCS